MNISTRTSDNFPGQYQVELDHPGPFEATVARVRHSDKLGPWIAGMFALKQTPGEWDGWEREMSYCEPRLTSFLADHVWRWYLEEWLKGDFSFVLKRWAAE
jgi:hypothetical protein